ncbi:hypothetical protein [Undibacterium sp. Di24W]|uniref:hypothetical protein n=1 Tax=Undibacterium sp. Di24W TaxID=3413033 RepID=UPI003BF41C54
MFFAHRTKQRFRTALVALAGFACLVGIVVAVFPGEDKSFVFSYFWWMLAIPLGLAAYAAFELFGTWSLSLPFWQRMPSWARVLLLVVLICAFVVATLFASLYFGDDLAF